MRFSLALTVTVTAATLLGGCSWFTGEPSPEEVRVERLKLPPDLVRDSGGGGMAIPGVASARESAGGQGGGEAVLPQPDDVRVSRVGDDRWLTVSESPGQVWRWVEDFMARRGLTVARKRPSLGVAETEWLYTEHPVTGGPFAPALPGPEGADVADRYLVRVEPGRDAQTAEVFVAHRRAVRDGGGWRPAASDPYLESEFLRSMLVFLGYERTASRAAVAQASASEPAARLERSDGEPALVVGNAFFDAWRRIGLALDRAGFTVEDRNRSEGVYFVRYDPQADQAPEDEGGLLSSLAFWRDDSPSDTVRTYRIALDGGDGVTRVRVRPAEGESAPEPAVAQQILGLLAEQLR